MDSARLDNAIQRQRAYYDATAENYDNAHEEPEHVVALHLLSAFIELAGIRSVLDVGAGTGRAMRFLKQRFPELVIKGVEPVEGLRRRGHAQGISENDLVAGDGGALPFPDESFDLVCEFAVLHHVPKPEIVVAEMSRVATMAVAISDCNFMGQGPTWLRIVKRSIWSAGLWPVANWFKTRGTGYTFSEDDGVAYSYSVFQSLDQIRSVWRDVSILPTSPNAASHGALLTSAGHVLLTALQKKVRQEN